MHARFLLLFILCFISKNILSASFFDLGQRSFTDIDTDTDGPITDVVQGPDGLIWVSTQRGLRYYDGFGLVEPASSAKRNDKSHYQMVNKVWFDSGENLYVATVGRGVLRLNKKTGKWQQFNRYTLNQSDVKHFEDSILDFAQDAQGRIWVLSGKLLCELSFKIQRLDCVDSLSNERLPKLNRILYHGNHLYLASHNGLLKLNVDGGVHSTVKIDTLAKNSKISTVAVDKNGAIWFAAKNKGVFRFSREAGFQGLSEFTNVVDIAFWDEQVWLASSVDGLRSLDLKSGRPLEHYNAASDGFFLPSNQISTIHIDRKGILWIGTFGNGLVLTNVANNSRRVLQNNKLELDRSISKNSVRAVKQLENGDLWLGIMAYGVDVFESGSLKKTTYPMAMISGEKKDLSGIMAIEQTEDKVVWLGSREGNLFRFDESQGKFETIDVGLELGRIEFLQSLSGGDLIVLAEDASFIWRQGGKVEIISIASGDAVEEKTRFYMAVKESENEIWLNGERYLYKLDSKTATAYREDVILCSGQSLRDGILIGPIVDSRGQIFAVKGPNLLQRVSKGNSTFCYEKKRQGSGFQGVALIGPEGHWWSYNYKVDKESLVKTTFPKIENRPFKLAWIRAKEKAKDGTFIFGSPYGVMFLRPERVRNKPFATSVNFTDVELDGKRFDHYADELIVDPSVQRVALSFLADDVANTESLRYRYRLHGFDNKWIEVDAENRRVAYTNLSPGSYNFEVQATNRDGSWSHLSRNSAVIVEPSWYQTHWFKSLVILAAVLVLYFIYRLRTWQMRQRQLELQSLVNVRTAELRESMEALSDTQEELYQSEKMAAIGRLVRGVAHEMNTPLGVLKMATSMLRDKLPKGEPENTGAAMGSIVSLLEGNISKLSGLVSNFKELSPEEYSSKNELFLISDLIAEGLSVRQSCLASIQLNISGDEYFSVYGNRSCLQIVILELIDNAIQHAWPSQDCQRILSISWRDFGECYEVSVEDNGKSVEQDMQTLIFEPFSTVVESSGVGLGLHKVSLLVTQHLSGEITCQQSSLGGCSFVIRMDKVTNEDAGRVHSEN